MTSIKRVRQVDDEPTSVQIIYKLLSRKSKKKLEELLHQWTEWHAQECSLSECSDEDLESGEETYLPALNVSSEKSCTISVYMDNQMKNKKQRTEDAQISKDSVPVYDRNFALLMSNDEVANKESVYDIMNASRCFNCDAYDHSLKECPKPFNKEVVNNARKLYQLKNLETRKLLCLGEFDPPPWLNRMREMGYPPGYFDLEDEDQPSGIIIFTNEDTKEENEKCIDSNFTESKRKMTVNFPGINAPIPVNADKSRWMAPNSQLKDFKSCSNNNSSLNKRVISSSESHFNYHSYEQSWRPECRPGSTSYMADYARGQYNYARAFPLLSNYANRYWDHINSGNPHNTFHG